MWRSANQPLKSKVICCVNVQDYSRNLSLLVSKLLAPVYLGACRLVYYHRGGERGLQNRQEVFFSDQRIVIFPANRNRNIFAEPTYVRIGIGIVHEFQNLQIGIRILFVRWEVFANNSRIPDIYFFSKEWLKISFSWLLYIFIWKILQANNAIVRYIHTLYIYSI